MKDINKKTIIAIAAILIFFVTLAAVGKNRGGKVYDEPLTDTTFALDTFITVSLYQGGDEEVLKKSISLIRDYEMVFSATNEDSELYKLNHREPGVTSVKVSDDLSYLIDKALYYCRISNGAFDITTEPLKAVWDFNTETPALPTDSEIKEILPKIDYKKLSVEGNEVKFTSDDTTIDLGAIAKGYIADKTKEFLISEGVSSAIINLGGNVLCIGKKPNGKDFTIGLQKPYAGLCSFSARWRLPMRGRGWIRARG